MTTYTTEMMPKGYTLIRWGVFSWGYKTAGFVTDFTFLTAARAREVAEKHAELMKTPQFAPCASK